jgi:hypothetical protein
MRPILPAMTNFSDAIQTLLQIPGVAAITGAILAVLLITALKATATLLRATRATLKFTRGLFPKMGVKNFLIIAFFAIFVEYKGEVISGWLQYFETRYLRPVASGEYADYSADHLTAIYETELRRHVDPYEFKVIQDSVRAMSVLFGCDSSAIYEAALPECGLNPFVIRRDGVAAGWIQFTNAGCKGLPFTLDHIKNWCKTRNTAAIMSATRQYLVSRSHNRHIKTGLDVYICVFAPAFLGCPADKAMYCTPSIEYQMNKNLDGWHIESGRIVRSPGAMDGKITVGELGLWMNYHKGQLIRKSLLKNL